MAAVQTTGPYLTCVVEPAIQSPDAVKEDTDGGGCSDPCAVFTALHMAIAQDGTTPARFMFLLCLVDGAPGDPEASQSLRV